MPFRLTLNYLEFLIIIIKIRSVSADEPVVLLLCIETGNERLYAGRRPGFRYMP